MVKVAMAAKQRLIGVFWCLICPDLSSGSPVFYYLLKPCVIALHSEVGPKSGGGYFPPPSMWATGDETF